MYRNGTSVPVTDFSSQDARREKESPIDSDSKVGLSGAVVDQHAGMEIRAQMGPGIGAEGDRPQLPVTHWSAFLVPP